MNCMKGEHISFVLAIFALLILSIGAASALTWISPTTGTTIKGVYNFNVTSGVGNVTNCTFKTTGDGNFAFVKNITGNQPSFNITNDTSLLTQTASTTLNATCVNASGTIDTAIITIGIDNNAPVCSFGIDSDETKYLSPIGVATTQSSTDLTTLTYAWTLWDVNGAVKTTKTSSAPTFAGTDFDNLGIYKLGLTVTDAASTSTTCSNKSIMVRGDNNPSPTQTIVAAQQQTKQNFTFLWVGVAVVMLLIVAIAAYFGLTSSKRRR